MEIGSLLALSALSWIGILKIVVVLVLVGVFAYFGKKYFDIEALKPIIALIEKIILDVEKSNKDLSGVAKKQIVEEIIAEKFPVADLRKIKKSPLKTIGVAVEYVFQTFAQPMILAKFGKKK